MRLCVIPARGGSKRIPRKNILEFCGKPIISYSIQAALDSNLFDHVVVSTDDNEIASVARRCGAAVPFIRPQELADDLTGTLPVVRHAVNWFCQNVESPESVCCIYATAPFVSPGDLKTGLDKLLKENCTYAFSVTSFPYPVQRALRVTDQNRIEMVYPEYRETRSQDLEDTWHDAGQFYWGKASAWKDGVPLFNQNVSPVIIPRYRVQDIDTMEDWIRAEWLYKSMKESGHDK